MAPGVSGRVLITTRLPAMAFEAPAVEGPAVEGGDLRVVPVSGLSRARPWTTSRPASPTTQTSGSRRWTWVTTSTGCR